MKKRYFSIALAMLGVLLIGYGIIFAEINNEAEIREIYFCDDGLDVFRETDKYCRDPETAPEAEFEYTNAFVYSGSAIILLSAISFINARLNND